MKDLLLSNKLSFKKKKIVHCYLHLMHVTKVMPKKGETLTAAKALLLRSYIFLTMSSFIPIMYKVVYLP